MDPEMNDENKPFSGSKNLPWSAFYLWCAVVGSAFLGLTQVMGWSTFQGLDGLNAVAWVILVGSVSYGVRGGFACRETNDYFALVSQSIGGAVASLILLTSHSGMDLASGLLLLALPMSLMVGYKVAVPRYTTAE